MKMSNFYDNSFGTIMRDSSITSPHHVTLCLGVTQLRACSAQYNLQDEHLAIRRNVHQTGDKGCMDTRDSVFQDGYGYFIFDPRLYIADDVIIWRNMSI